MILSLGHYEVSKEGIVNNNTAILIAAEKTILSAIHEACNAENLLLKKC